LPDPFVIPEERLPPGFARTLDRPPAVPVEPRPAATAVLMRDAAAGPEILLLKRHRSSGFVPGAYVFPGGRVDPADRESIELLQTVSQAEDDSSFPAAEYWIAALREIFEETGVLLARTTTGAWSAAAGTDPNLEEWREGLMTERASLGELLEARQLTLDAREMAYLAHWITPVAEPRRFDTRFFLARLPAQQEVRADPREMDDAVWLTAAEALSAFQAGRLTMVFPTVKTLQMLEPYHTVEQALQAARRSSITPILPRLVRTGEGVGIVIDQD
jgi:8-oxo-dGTP pyrophosphatase MutT (NUDIX family)